MQEVKQIRKSELKRKSEHFWQKTANRGVHSDGTSLLTPVAWFREGEEKTFSQGNSTVLLAPVSQILLGRGQKPGSLQGSSAPAPAVDLYILHQLLFSAAPTGDATITFP